MRAYPSTRADALVRSAEQIDARVIVDPAPTPDAAAESPRAVLTRRRRWVIGALLAVAIVTGFVAIFSTWVKRQALDTHHWTNTSGDLLANKNVQGALGVYLTNELFTKVDVAGELQKKLPEQAKALAGPAAAGLQEVATRTAPALLARPRVQDGWRSANQAAHKQLIALLNGGGSNVSTANGNVTLNLHSLVDQLAASLGIEQQVATVREKASGQAGAAAQRLGVNVKLPPSTGQLVILRSKQLKAAQDIAKGVRNLSIITTIISLGLFALAIWLAHGVRRRALRTVGWSFVALGLATLLIRRIAGNQLVDGLVKSDSAKPAAHDAWHIATSLLYSIAISMVIYGLVIVLAAWLAGPARSAIAARRGLAAPLRERPALVYANVGLVFLLVLVWGPTPAFRNLLPVLIIAALLVLGVEVIRHQTAREFPEAARGDASRAVRGWFDGRGGRAAAATHAGNGEVGRLD